MDLKELEAMTDEELLAEAKKLKSAAMMNAAFIGFLVGIIIYSVAKNSLGFFTLIPLFLIYKLVNNSKYDRKEVERLLKERNLK